MGQGCAWLNSGKVRVSRCMVGVASYYRPRFPLLETRSSSSSTHPCPPPCLALHKRGHTITLTMPSMPTPSCLVTPLPP